MDFYFEDKLKRPSSTMDGKGIIEDETSDFMKSILNRMRETETDVEKMFQDTIQNYK